MPAGWSRMSGHKDGCHRKARAACWALLGDQVHDRQAAGASVVRDLIRLYDPGLEQPGALKELVKGIENGASQSTNSWVQSNATQKA